MTAPSGPDNQQQKPDQNQQPVIPNQYAFLWLSAAIFLMVLWLQDGGQPRLQDLAYSEFKTAVVNNQVAEVTLKEEAITGLFTDSGAADFSSDSPPHTSTKPSRKEKP